MAVSTCHHFNISINISQVSGTPLLLIHDQQTFNHLNNRKNNFEQEKDYPREHGPSLLGCGWYCLDLVTNHHSNCVSGGVGAVLWRVGHQTCSGQSYCGHQRGNT